MWRGRGRYATWVTLTGSLISAATAPLGRPRASARSCRPSAAEASASAGARTPVARLTPSVPARGLVKRSIVLPGGESPGTAVGLSIASSDAVKWAGITTAAYSPARFIWCSIAARSPRLSARRLVSAPDRSSALATLRPRSTVRPFTVAPTSSFTTPTGNPCRCPAGSTTDPRYTSVITNTRMATTTRGGTQTPGALNASETEALVGWSDIPGPSSLEQVRVSLGVLLHR